MPLLLGAAFLFIAAFYPTNAYSEIKVAIIDTGFCPEKISRLKKNITIQSQIDFTRKKKWDCSKISKKVLNSSPRFHGHKVLLEFLKFAPKKEKITVKPMVVFDLNGEQSKEAWIKAIKYVDKGNFDFVLSASGFVTKEKLVDELPGIWFVPSGRIERSIKKSTILFPQSLAPQVNLYLIGDYNDGRETFYDQSLLYQNVIDYYFPVGKGSFKGTSRAVAEAFGIALRSCYKAKELSPPHAMRLCLLKKSKNLRDPVLKIDFKTYQ